LFEWPGDTAWRLAQVPHRETFDVPRVAFYMLAALLLLNQQHINNEGKTCTLNSKFILRILLQPL